MGAFLESAPCPGRAYKQEVLGDDYFPEFSKEADARLIVATFEENAKLREIAAKIVKTGTGCGCAVTKCTCGYADAVKELGTI